MSVESLNILIEEINSLKTERLLKQRNKIKQQEWFFNFKGKLPSNWLEVNFMDVTWLITCGVAKKPDYVDDGIPFLSAQNTRPFKTNLNKIKYITQEAFDKLTVGGKPEKNDVLYTRVGNCGEAASIPYDFDFGVYVSLTLIKPIHELIDHKFLVAFLNSNYGKIQANVGAIGIGLKNLNVENVRKYRIPLSPLPEQRAIVAKIEELFSDLDKGVADLKKAQDQLKIYRHAVLKKAFDGELTKEWREQQTNLPTAYELLGQIKEERQKHYEQQLENWKEAVKAWEENGKEGKKPGKPKAIKSVEEFTHTEIKNIGELPNKWNWVRLGNIFQVFVGSTPSRSKTEYWKNGTINWVSSGEVTFSSIFKTKEKITAEGLKNASTTVHPVGTVMLAMIGEGKTRGQAGILEIEACHNQNTAAIRVSEIGFLPKFLFHYLFLKYERNRGIGSGNNQKALNQGRIMDFDYPLCSVKEQHQIVQEIESRLSVCDKVEESISESLEKAKALRQSILKKAFEGTLLSVDEIEKCKTAPDYEPAKVLLEKIKMKQ